MLDNFRDAEKIWRNIIKIAYPLKSDIPVNIISKKSGEPFKAYTDLKKIIVEINDPKYLEDGFKKAIAPLYKKSANSLYNLSGSADVKDDELNYNLAVDTAIFILTHELIHQWCPTSADDRKKIAKAMYNGIKKAEPMLSKKDVFRKVNNCKNLVWDIIDNVEFIASAEGLNNSILYDKMNYVFNDSKRNIGNEDINRYPYGIPPVIYAISAANNTTDILISLMGLMYSTMSFNDAAARENMCDLFERDLSGKKIRNDAFETLEDIFHGLVFELDAGKLKDAKIDKKEYLLKSKKMKDLKDALYNENREYIIRTITGIFDSPSLRYDAIKGLAEKLSEYISVSEKQGSFDRGTSTEGGGGDDHSEQDESGDEESDEDSEGDSMSSTLDDLLGTLDEKEADDLLKEIANDTADENGTAQDKSMQKVSFKAADEYYKKHSDPIEIRNPKSENISIDLGKKKKWKLKSSKNISEAEATLLNFDRIKAFQIKTGLPILVPLSGGHYKLNEYILDETNQKSYMSQFTGIEIPDNWILLGDSSYSMTETKNYVGSGNEYDILMRINYGVSNPLYNLCKMLKKDLMFGYVNFSSGIIYNGVDLFTKIYESSDHKIKTTLLDPQCGNTYLNTRIFDDIEKDLHPGRTLYTLITDGAIVGDTDNICKKIKAVSSKKDASFLFIEVNSNSSLGTMIKDLSRSSDSLLYYNVDSVSSIKKILGSVLIKYNK